LSVDKAPVSPGSQQRIVDLPLLLRPRLSARPFPFLIHSLPKRKSSHFLFSRPSPLRGEKEGFRFFSSPLLWHPLRGTLPRLSRFQKLRLLPTTSPFSWTTGHHPGFFQIKGLWYPRPGYLTNSRRFRVPSLSARSRRISFLFFLADSFFSAGSIHLRFRSFYKNTLFFSLFLKRFSFLPNERW